mmetsp:Transcript_164382/g.527166  ORF Transcript_164382/g.527166 Transcript_164382/m.527166 type:complete len:255 (-) Transcript_164382:76-840(-)
MAGGGEVPHGRQDVVVVDHGALVVDEALLPTLRRPPRILQRASRCICHRIPARFCARCARSCRLGPLLIYTLQGNPLLVVVVVVRFFIALVCVRAATRCLRLSHARRLFQVARERSLSTEPTKIAVVGGVVAPINLHRILALVIVVVVVVVDAIRARIEGAGVVAQEVVVGLLLAVTRLATIALAAVLVGLPRLPRLAPAPRRLSRRPAAGERVQRAPRSLRGGLLLGEGGGRHHVLLVAGQADQVHLREGHSC